MSILNKYYRSPGIHVTLPSGGNFTPPEELDTAINGELAVLPMTSADEVLTKNPDGLLNGYSIEQIVRSCVPGVRNPRNLPTQDMDYLLMAIKLTTFGDTMELNAKCPKCSKPTEFGVSIRERLGMTTPMASEYMVRVTDEVVVYLRPYDYASNTKLNLAAFEETKLFQALLNSEISDEDRSRMFTASYEKIAYLNLELLSRCVMRVVVPDGVVSDADEIRDYIRNSPKQTVEAIQERLREIAKTGLDKTVHVTCDDPECEHEWTTELTFDPSHFFA